MTNYEKIKAMSVEKMAERLIDAEALETKIKKIEAEALEHGFAPEYVAVDMLLDFLNGAPTIEAKPIVHAHWDEVSGDRTICTNCGNYPLYDYFGRLKLSDVCPHCGAQMDEKEND